MLFQNTDGIDYIEVKMDSDNWISLNEISTYLGVSRETIYKWIEKRDMPGCRIGRNWKFKKSEVDAWIHSGKANDDGKTGQRKKTGRNESCQH